MAGALLPAYGVRKVVCCVLRAGNLPSRNLAACLPHVGGEVEAERGQRALPWGGEGGACLVTSSHPKGVSRGAWPAVEMSVGPRGLRLCEEGRRSWPGSAGRLSPKLLQGSEGDPASSGLPRPRPSPRKEEQAGSSESLYRVDMSACPHQILPAGPRPRPVKSRHLGGGSSLYRSFSVAETCTVEGTPIASANRCRLMASLHLSITPAAHPRRVV